MKRVTISRWADEGEKWLSENFKGKHVAFHTAWDTAADTITLEVFKVAEVRRGKQAEPHQEFQLIFTETCKAENFVSQLTVTKIMLMV